MNFWHVWAFLSPHYSRYKLFSLNCIIWSIWWHLTFCDGGHKGGRKTVKVNFLKNGERGDCGLLVCLSLPESLLLQAWIILITLCYLFHLLASYFLWRGDGNWMVNMIWPFKIAERSKRCYHWLILKVDTLYGSFIRKNTFPVVLGYLKIWIEANTWNFWQKCYIQPLIKIMVEIPANMFLLRWILQIIILHVISLS